MKPINDMVLVKPDENIEATKSGILLAAEAVVKTQTGTVIETGFGKYIDGKLIPVCVAPNTKILYSKYAGEEISYNDENYLLIKEKDILAVLED